ncbi:unnamed protein product, partial [Lepidochelys kempii]
MKIVYLLFAVFFLVLQSTPGFTFIKNPFACVRAGGFCTYTCYTKYSWFGSCGSGQTCCRRRW